MRRKLRRRRHAARLDRRRAATARRRDPRSTRASSSCRPSRVPCVARHHAAQKGRREVAALSAVRARVDDRPRHRHAAASAAGSAAASSSPSAAAASPSRSPNCSMSQVASACFHLASSSHQAAANCGPRRLSGSSDENAMRHRAVRPFEPPLRADPARPFVSASRARSSPDGPCTITSRTSASVSPTSAMRSTGAAAKPAAAERQRPHPFGAGARLARAAPAEHQPGRPVSRRRPSGRRAPAKATTWRILVSVHL